MPPVCYYPASKQWRGSIATHTHTVAVTACHSWPPAFQDALTYLVCCVFTGAIAEQVAAQLTDQDLEDLDAAANSPQIQSVLRAYTTPV
jgi:hypothetical protein